MCFPMTVWCPYSRSMYTCFALARSVVYKSNQPLIHDGNHWDTTLERGPSLPDTPPMKTKVKIAEVGWDHIKERAIMGVIEDKPEMSTTKRPRKKSYGEGRTKEERARALKEVETFDNFDSLVKGDNNIEYQGQSRKRSSMTSDGTSAVGASEWSIALDDSFKQHK
jgi:hypothetical protein